MAGGNGVDRGVTVDGPAEGGPLVEETAGDNGMEDVTMNEIAGDDGIDEDVTIDGPAPLTVDRLDEAGSLDRTTVDESAEDGPLDRTTAGSLDRTDGSLDVTGLEDGGGYKIIWHETTT